MSGSAKEAETPHLLAYLATIADPRTRAGRRHPLVAILGLAAAAVVAGARSIAAIAEWAADTPQPVRAAFGTRRDPVTGHWAVSTEATIPLRMPEGLHRHLRAGVRHPVHPRACVCQVPNAWPDPAQCDRLAEIRDNLLARIAEAEREGWLGEVEGLTVSLAGVKDKLAQLERRGRSHAVDLSIPTVPASR